MAEERIRVVVRVRPLLPRELLDPEVVDTEGTTVRVTKDNLTTESRFDHVFPRQTAQSDVYSEIQDSIAGVLEGFNTTIFAYGQTGTGKTYTMLGGDFTGKHYKNISVGHASDDDGEGTRSDPLGKAHAHRGIIPRSVDHVFREAKKDKEEGRSDIKVKCSYMEIYNERLHDLLEPYKPKKIRDKLDMVQKKSGLEMRENKRGEVSIVDLTELKVTSASAVMSLISKGNKHRAVRQTEMNEQSSRSHTILQMTITQRSLGGEDGAAGTLTVSKLNLVDLAGSERWSAHAEMEEDRISELTNINQSLSALAMVIGRLSSKAENQHIPYRDSKLTHLLQDSLGGNCKTTIIATISPSDVSYEETCSTLKFADRARNITTAATMNTSEDSSLQVDQLKREVQRLRGLLAVYATDKPLSGKSTPKSNAAVLEGKLAAAEDENTNLRTQLIESNDALKELVDGTAAVAFQAWAQCWDANVDGKRVRLWCYEQDGIWQQAGAAEAKAAQVAATLAWDQRFVLELPSEAHSSPSKPLAAYNPATVYGSAARGRA
eukprot:gene15351-18161_t